MANPEPKVLCRTCSNWIGRSTGPERRAAMRPCGAGLLPVRLMFECESYVARPIAAAISATSTRREARSS